MTIKRLYFGVENVALTPVQRDTLAAGIQALGANSDPNPASRNHWRVRLDSDAVIFEGAHDDDNLTVLALRTRLANLFGVPLAQVTATTSNPAAGTVVTISYQAIARCRFVIFGGASATHQQSGDAARASSAANSAAWGET